jgi:signal transduction histidine kinase
MLPERWSGLQGQLLLAAGLLVLAAASAVAVVSRYGARVEFRRFQDIERRAVFERSRTIEPAVAEQLDGACCGRAQLDGAAAILGPDLALYVIDEGTRALAGAAGAPLATLREVTVRWDGRELFVDAERPSGGGPVEALALRFLSRGTALRRSDGRAARVHVVPMPSALRARAAAAVLGAFDRRLLGLTAAVAFVAMAGLWLIARRTVGPIEDLEAATREIASGRLDRRVAPRGSREVADLARSFNAMADELARQQSLRRALVVDVAHELRTPLTAAQCRLEMVQDGVAPDPGAALRQAHEEVRHLARLADDLQDIALAEARELRLERGDVPLAAVAASALAAAGLDGDPRVTLDVPGGLHARGDVTRVRQMLLNLLTNAQRYTPPNGSIRVAAVAEDDGEVIVEVTNTGSHLEPEEAARVFDRFYRTDPSRQRVSGGTGLGLAIVKHLAQAQGGRAWVSSDADSVTVGFSLPRAVGEE